MGMRPTALRYNTQENQKQKDSVRVIVWGAAPRCANEAFRRRAKLAHPGAEGQDTAIKANSASGIHMYDTTGEHTNA